MIIGTHTILYSRDAEADRAFFRDVLALEHVDAGRGWLIFALPPSEIALHPAHEETPPQFYLLTDNLEAELARLRTHHVPHAPITEARWGTVTTLTLPSGSTIGLYQPKHPLAIQVTPPN